MFKIIFTGVLFFTLTDLGAAGETFFVELSPIKPVSLSVFGRGVGGGFGLKLPAQKLWSIAEFEKHESSYLKRDVNKTSNDEKISYSVNIFFIGLRGYLYLFALENFFWEGKFVYINLKGNVFYGDKERELSTQRTGIAIGGGYNFFPNSFFLDPFSLYLKLGLWAVIPFLTSGAKKNDWPDSEGLSEGTEVHDILSDVFFKTDISLGYRF